MKYPSRLSSYTPGQGVPQNAIWRSSVREDGEISTEEAPQIGGDDKPKISRHAFPQGFADKLRTWRLADESNSTVYPLRIPFY